MADEEKKGDGFSVYDGAGSLIGTGVSWSFTAETDDEAFTRLARLMIDVVDRGNVSEATTNDLREVLSDKEKRRSLIQQRYAMDARFRALAVAVATAIEHNGMMVDDARDVGEAVALGLGKP